MRFNRDGEEFGVPRSEGPSKRELRETLAKAVANTGAAPGGAADGHAKLVRLATATVSHPPIEPPSPPVSVRGVRPIQSFKIKENVQPISSAFPSFRMVRPTDLKIEETYQRNISRKSIKLIHKIAIGWDWAKFKPPVVADTKAGLFIIDGQHTAIAAASRQDIPKIAVMIVDAGAIERRAAAFVAHNRDRIAMTPAEIFHGELAAGDATTRYIAKLVDAARAIVPRHAQSKEQAKSNQIAAVGELRDINRSCGGEMLGRVLRIAVLSGIGPISLTMLRGIKIALTDDEYSHCRRLGDEKIAHAVASIKDFENAVRARAGDLEISRFNACAALIAGRLKS